MTAFITAPVLSVRRIAPRWTMSTARDDISTQAVSRRAVLTGIASTSLLTLLTTTLPADVGAKVDIDIERFGDKGKF